MEKGEVVTMAEKLVPNMEAKMKVKPTEKMGGEQTKLWHKPKNGSIFPAKRKSVKQMMWDRVVGPNMGFKMGSPSFKSKGNNSVHPCSS
ncbi:hypothetical protein VNO77_10259 [Canavalia gladiata]|uniref:Uncharacterized protein n=1 Tax=Canavalia gladiata TaxID=3824 RepID=A0AAN9MGR5_CANGL